MREPSAQGTIIPVIAMATINPVVFKETVFPPVLGPLITIIGLSADNSSVIGTGRLSKGWRACRIIS